MIRKCNLDFMVNLNGPIANIHPRGRARFDNSVISKAFRSLRATGVPKGE